MSGGSLTTRARIIDWLRSNAGCSASADDIAAAHGLQRRTVEREMHLMRLEGVLEQTAERPSTKHGECRQHVLVDKRSQERARLAADPRFAAWAAGQ